MNKTKQEAADYLGVSIRTIESYAAQNKLSVSYARGKRGQVAMFDDEELDRLKAELSEPIYPQRPAVAGSSEKLTIRPDAALGTIDTLALVERLSELFQSRIRLTEKLTLSLEEAAELSGLSQYRLRVDTRQGKLKSIGGGKGYRIKRVDLDAYIDSL
jgi:excisionase family DNA binding protein